MVSITIVGIVLAMFMCWYMIDELVINKDT